MHVRAVVVIDSDGEMWAAVVKEEDMGVDVGFVEADDVVCLAVARVNNFTESASFFRWQLNFLGGSDEIIGNSELVVNKVFLKALYFL